MHDAVVTNIFRYTLYLYVIRRLNKPVSRSISLLGLPAAPGVAARSVGKSETNSHQKEHSL